MWRLPLFRARVVAATVAGSTTSLVTALKGGSSCCGGSSDGDQNGGAHNKKEHAQQEPRTFEERMVTIYNSTPVALTDTRRHLKENGFEDPDAVIWPKWKLYEDAEYSFYYDASLAGGRDEGPSSSVRTEVDPVHDFISVEPDPASRSLTPLYEVFRYSRQTVEINLPRVDVGRDEHEEFHEDEGSGRTQLQQEFFLGLAHYPRFANNISLEEAAAWNEKHAHIDAFGRWLKKLDPVRAYSIKKSGMATEERREEVVRRVKMGRDLEDGPTKAAPGAGKSKRVAMATMYMPWKHSRQNSFTPFGELGVEDEDFLRADSVDNREWMRQFTYPLPNADAIFPHVFTRSEGGPAPAKKKFLVCRMTHMIDGNAAKASFFHDAFEAEDAVERADATLSAKEQFVALHWRTKSKEGGEPEPGSGTPSGYMLKDETHFFEPVVLLKPVRVEQLEQAREAFFADEIRRLSRTHASATDPKARQALHKQMSGLYEKTDPNLMKHDREWLESFGRQQSSVTLPPWPLYSRIARGPDCTTLRGTFAGQEVTATQNGTTNMDLRVFQFKDRGPGWNWSKNGWLEQQSQPIPNQNNKNKDREEQEQGVFGGVTGVGVNHLAVNGEEQEGQGEGEKQKEEPENTNEESFLQRRSFLSGVHGGGGRASWTGQLRRNRHDQEQDDQQVADAGHAHGDGHRDRP